MDTTIRKLHIEAYRAVRAEALYDVSMTVTVDAFNAAVKAALCWKGKVNPTPEDFIEMAKNLPMKCPRCAGTGQFITMVENGQPKGPGGPCFRCDGKGFQKHGDAMRNAAYDRHQCENVGLSSEDSDHRCT